MYTITWMVSNGAVCNSEIKPNVWYITHKHPDSRTLLAFYFESFTSLKWKYYYNVHVEKSVWVVNVSNGFISPDNWRKYKNAFDQLLYIYIFIWRYDILTHVSDIWPLLNSKLLKRYNCVIEHCNITCLIVWSIIKFNILLDLQVHVITLDTHCIIKNLKYNGIKIN